MTLVQIPDISEVKICPRCGDVITGAYHPERPVISCSRCWADWVAHKQAQQRERARKGRQGTFALAPRKELDCHSWEFDRRVQAVFGRKINGDGPIKFERSTEEDG